ncbi:MAG: S8 family serine peptidase [Gammaproteobacteria bacterium]|nr:S8 family serine peptidase [Gammaproteobacteria bacterium]
MQRSVVVRRAGWLFVGTAACGIGVAIWFALARDAVQLEPDTDRGWSESERHALETMIEQVAAETRTGLRTVRIEGAPRRGSQSDPHVSQAEVARPSPPEGYTFVEHLGEIPTERFRPRTEAGGASLEVGPDWLGPPGAFSRIVEKAALAGREWSFGWIRVAPDARLADITPSLEALAVVVEGSAGPLVRARLPGDLAALEAVVALSGVEALGAAPLAAKLPPPFAEQVLGQAANDVVPVFVTLMAEESNGRWGGELERRGAVVGAYDSDTRAYVANVEYGIVNSIAEADFVQFVEPVGVVKATHDTAVPAMGADVHRTYQGEPGSFTGTGGASVPIAVMDTGLNINHLDIVSNRDSICGANFVTPSRAEDQDLWSDVNGHGTHVTGTVVGNGAATPRYAGMAPLVRDIRFAKVLSSRGFGPYTAINAGMDFLSEPTECSGGGWSTDRVKPLIVNMSLSANSRSWEGRDQPARKLDAVVWRHRQLYVVAQSNAYISGFSNYGAAKNSLPVGAALDSGEMAGFTSFGPTADGRLAPLVVGTGVSLSSAAGDGSVSGYRILDGTSMASPSVAGVAALLMDAVPVYRDHPALARARLMASAIKPDAWFEDPDAFPEDNTGGPGTMNAPFGMGKVSAQTSILVRDQPDGWTGGGFTATFEDDEYAYHDIDVPADASRLDVVLTWDEPPADAIANAVLNDLDLWLDHGGDCADVQCGERSSVSLKDNVEWVIVRNPSAGMWRAKVAASRIYTEAPRAALAWKVIRGPATPELAVTADRSTMDGSDELTVTVSVDGYVAAGARLYLECRALAEGQDEEPDEEPADVVPCFAGGNDIVTNADGLVQAASSVGAGGSVALGEIAVGESREVRFDSLHVGAGSAIHFTATAWNATASSIAVAGGMDTAEEVTAIEHPDNDAFAAAEILEGAHGHRALDMFHATPEPGEPDYLVGGGRPAGSVWYRWKATAAGPVHFGVVPDESYRYRELRFDILEGDSVAGAKTIASTSWGASFFALPDREYVVRISHPGQAPRGTMHWRRGPRPENDAFAAATPIGAEAERVAGSNLGATLEPGEYFGGLGGTVWYTWTAPDDAYWQFRVNASHLKVLAFSGETIDELRLVSEYPAAAVVFPTGEAEHYRIAVASQDAYMGGSRFDLSWSTVGRAPSQDDFAEAQELPSVDASSWLAEVQSDSTVQPGEPIDTGVRTRWWSWTAPASGAHTWRLVGPDPGLTLSAFTGDTLEGLSPLGVADATDIEFAFSADAEQSYRVAVGVSSDHAHAFVRNYQAGRVEFGPTPENDAWSSATALAAASGMVTGSNRYATTEDHERIHDVGHSSLWWTFEAPADGWYRFWVGETSPPFTLAVFEYASVPAAQLELIVSSGDPDGGRAEIVFEATAGDRFAIRLGTFGGDEGDDFTLHWEETDATLLAYTGRFTPTGEANGETVDIANLRRLTLDATGKALYAASRTGLSVMGRDPDTGALTSEQFFSGAMQSAALFWDPENTRLLVFNGCEVRAYAAVDGTYRRLREDENLSITGEQPCHVELVFMDPAREFFYAVDPYRSIRVYAYENEDTLRYIQTIELGISDAMISNAGRHVYALENYVLYALQRDEDTGELTELSQTSVSDQVIALAVSDDDRYLFAFGRIGTFVYDLADPADPQMLRSLTPPRDRPWDLNCNFSVPRNERHAADAFCVNSAYAVEWTADSGNFEVADFVSSWRANRLGQTLPRFDYPRGFAASPEGRHAYGSTSDHGILIFERVGNPIIDVDTGEEDGYVRLGTLTVAVGTVQFGPLSSAKCIALEDLTIDDIEYDVDTSKWQTRPDADGTWADIEDTETTGEVCAYTPTETGQYRMVVEMDIDGEAGKYASNTLDHEAD